MSPTCSRSWQAEALEDGRLEPSDRASFERHAETCRDCAVELSELSQLRQRLLAFPDYGRTELEHRRARSALLNVAELRFRAPRSARLAWALALAVPALIGALLFLRAWRSHPAPPGFEVADVSHADWSAKHIGATSQVTLRDGVASFHVEHVAAAARFLVQLPDGQIEVRGTRFVVDVAGGVTRSVSVSEGLVWLRLGQRLVILKQGEAYRASEAARPVAPIEPANRDAGPDFHSRPAVPVSTASEAPSMPRPAVESASPRTSSTPSALPPIATASATRRSEAVAALPSAGAPARAATAGEKFGEAMAAFVGGDYGRADALFAAFGREFPGDSRVEDAAFLRANAHARRGDAAGAAALARDYLKRYPNGLRRPDAERLAGKP